MKRSYLETRRLLDAVEEQQNNSSGLIQYADEFVTAGPTSEQIALAALVLYVAPAFVPYPMWINNVLAGLSTASGTVSYRLAIYKAVRPERRSRDHVVTTTPGGGATYSTVRDGAFEWQRLALGPIISHTAGLLGRYFWKLDRDIIHAPPDILGVAFMADSSNGVFLGGANSIATHTSSRALGTRAGLNDFPDILSTVQGAQIPVPCFALRSPRALSWIGG